MDEVELAWAAGFFDGEGTITIVSRNPTAGRRRAGDLYVGVNQALSPLDRTETPPTLVRFQAAIGFGGIHGPYHQDATRRPIFKWYVRNGQAGAALELLWPFLSATKRAQADAVREELARLRAEFEPHTLAHDSAGRFIRVVA